MNRRLLSSFCNCNGESHCIYQENCNFLSLFVFVSISAPILYMMFPQHIASIAIQVANFLSSNSKSEIPEFKIHTQKLSLASNVPHLDLHLIKFACFCYTGSKLGQPICGIHLKQDIGHLIYCHPEIRIIF